MFTKLSSFQRSLVSAVAGFLAYGVWAYLVNSMHGWQVGLKAACVQGSYSFTLTFIMTISMEALFTLILSKSRKENKRFSAILTTIIVCLFMYSTSWLINLLAGTPEIFNTVILGYIIGTLYTVAYTTKLALS